MTLTIRLARNFKSFDRFTRFRIVRTMSSQSFLVDHPRYAFLKDLGLQSHNQGVYNGKWFANGMVSFEMSDIFGDLVADMFVLWHLGSPVNFTSHRWSYCWSLSGQCWRLWCMCRGGQKGMEHLGWYSCSQTRRNCQTDWSCTER